MKRTIDIFISISFIFLFSPIFLGLALLILLESGYPIIYRQARIGKNGQTFFMLKFRSMLKNELNPYSCAVITSNNKYVTKVGAFMRRTKLDEIPQFLNVLFGDMSLIGPRPCLKEHLNKMTKLEKRRFSILPGLTCLSEIYGLDMNNWQKYLKYDLWYVDHRSLKLDFYILAKTFLFIIFGTTTIKEKY